MNPKPTSSLNRWNGSTDKKTMIYLNKQITDMSDDELIDIINSLDYGLVPNNIRNAARSELHKRKKKMDTSTNKMTLLILLFTIGIAILTVILVVFAIKDRFPIAEDRQSPMIQPLPQQHEPTTNDKYQKSADQKKHDQIKHNAPPKTK